VSALAGVPSRRTKARRHEGERPSPHRGDSRADSGTCADLIAEECAADGRLEPFTVGQYWGDSDRTRREVKTLTHDAWARLQQIRAERDPSGLFVDYLGGPGAFATATAGKRTNIEEAGGRGSGSRTESGRRRPADPAGQHGRGPAEVTAMVFRTDRSIGLERRPVPAPRDDQVLIDVDLCGICGSDLHAPLTPGLPRRIHHGAPAGAHRRRVTQETRTRSRPVRAGRPPPSGGGPWRPPRAGARGPRAA
jgi:hypothetical protein